MPKTYKVFRPPVIRRRIVEVSEPNSTEIVFGIHTVNQVETKNGPATLVRGSDIAEVWDDPKYKEFLIWTGEARTVSGLKIHCYNWRNQYWVRGIREGLHGASVRRKLLGRTETIQHILYPIRIQPEERAVKLKEFLYNDGVIRINDNTGVITLVRHSMLVEGIPCTPQDVDDLIDDGVAAASKHGDDTVLRVAPLDVTITRSDREVFRALLDHWDESNAGLPGYCSYKDLYELCSKFNVHQPARLGLP